MFNISLLKDLMLKGSGRESDFIHRFKNKTNSLFIAFNFAFIEASTSIIWEKKNQTKTKEEIQEEKICKILRELDRCGIIVY